MPQKTPSELQNYIDDFFADNDTNNITPAQLRQFCGDVIDSFVHNTIGETKEDVAADFLPHLEPLLFDKKRVYGSVASPCTGDIPAMVSDAKLMTDALIIHSQGIVPTFPAYFNCLSGTYDTSKVNRIRCTYIGEGLVDYIISQEP